MLKREKIIAVYQILCCIHIGFVMKIDFCRTRLGLKSSLNFEVRNILETVAYLVIAEIMVYAFQNKSIV